MYFLKITSLSFVAALVSVSLTMASEPEVGKKFPDLKESFEARIGLEREALNVKEEDKNTLPLETKGGEKLANEKGKTSEVKPQVPLKEAIKEIPKDQTQEVSEGMKDVKEALVTPLGQEAQEPATQKQVLDNKGYKVIETLKITFETKEGLEKFLADNTEPLEKVQSLAFVQEVFQVKGGGLTQEQLDKLIALFPNVEYIEGLSLEINNIKSIDLSKIGSLIHLKELSIFGILAGDSPKEKAPKDKATLPQKEEEVVKSLAALSSLIKLEKLELNIPLKDRQLGFLEQLTSLKTLKLLGFDITKDNIALLLKAPELKTLEISKDLVNPALEEDLKKNPRNITLQLWESPKEMKEPSL